MMERPASLFVLAHQDDEIAAAPRIVFEVARGRSVLCVYLTDGGGGAAAPSLRNSESAAVLRSLGVPPAGMYFTGSEVPIRDGVLVENLDVALERLEHLTEGIEIETVYCLAWEGGHQDHDASHLVAAAFALRRGLLDRCFEFPLYRGSRLHGRLFRVLSPLRRGRRWEKRTLPFAEGLRFSLLAWRYRSQRHSFLGLFPELFLKLGILRRELVRAVDVARLTKRPHEGRLLYESRFRFPHERFRQAAADFLERHFHPSAT